MCFRFSSTSTHIQQQQQPKKKKKSRTEPFKALNSDLKFEFCCFCCLREYPHCGDINVLSTQYNIWLRECELFATIVGHKSCIQIKYIIIKYYEFRISF